MEAQGPEIRTSPYANPRENYGSSIILMTNPDKELYKLELVLRNQKLSKDDEVEVCGVPLLNDEGINSVLGQVQSLVNQVTVMSNLDKKEIPSLMDFLADTLARDLMLNRTNYAIRGSSARDKIYFSALSTAYVTLKRAYEEGDKRFWKGSVQEIHSKVESSKGSGFLDKINPWSK